MTSTSAPRSRILSWCLYDWANSSFTTLVVTFVYSTYFTSTFAADPDHEEHNLSKAKRILNWEPQTHKKYPKKGAK